MFSKTIFQIFYRKPKKKSKNEKYCQNSKKFKILVNHRKNYKNFGQKPKKLQNFDQKSIKLQNFSQKPKNSKFRPKTEKISKKISQKPKKKSKKISQKPKKRRKRSVLLTNTSDVIILNGKFFSESILNLEISFLKV